MTSQLGPVSGPLRGAPARFAPASEDDRAAATEFVGKLAQLDPAGLVRIVAAADGDDGDLDLWARAGFGVAAVRRVRGTVQPDPLTAYATNLIAGLAVSRSEEVDAGTDASAEWHMQMPPSEGWRTVGVLTSADIRAAVAAARVTAERAVVVDRANELRARTKATVPPAILDSPLLDVVCGEWRIPVAMRVLFALSGLGLAEPTVGDEVEVRVTATWLRLDTARGSVARRRMADLPAL